MKFSNFIFIKQIYSNSLFQNTSVKIKETQYELTYIQEIFNIVTGFINVII